MARYRYYDFLDCLMAQAGRLGYGVHYGKLVAETSASQRVAMAEEGRNYLERRDAMRDAAARRRKPIPKGEGRYL